MAQSRSSAPASTARPPLFEVRRSAIQGRGAFAARTIRKGQRIVEYVGERITQDEADRRYDDGQMGRHHTFLFTLDDDTVIDGKVGGNASRFINHSCAPNCEAVIEGSRIFIHALHAIQAGEELLYDYQYERTDEHTPEDEALYACRCGAPNCRGTILAPPKPPRRAASTRKTAKKAGAKKAGAKKAGAKKAGAKKGGAKRAAKTGGSKHQASRHATRALRNAATAPAGKQGGKQATAKKTTKSAAKKTGAKKTAAKKTAAKKTAAKKGAARKTTTGTKSASRRRA